MKNYMVLDHKQKGCVHIFEMYSVGQENLRHRSGQEDDPLHVFAVTCTRIGDFRPVLVEFENGKIVSTEMFRDGKFEEWLLEKMQLQEQE